LVSNKGNEIKATHATPVKEYIDDLTFTFSGAKDNPCTCDVSISELVCILFKYIYSGTSLSRHLCQEDHGHLQG
jgi:hypothetical protein